MPVPCARNETGDPSPPGKGAMITRTADWKNALATAVRDPADLIETLNLPATLLEPTRSAAAQFPLRVPPDYLSAIAEGNPHDPLLRQVLPSEAELQTVPGFEVDPVGDRAAAVLPGVLHKYRGRVLLTVTGACAVHCRYCFRRHFPYTTENPRSGDWEPALRYIAADTSIREVILSGGDPLTVDDPILAELSGRLDTIGHLRRLRIHSRMPTVVPERVGDPLLAWLTASRLSPVMVVHVNHPAELQPAARRALEELRGAGIWLFNQAVLLRGVNDSLDTLTALSEQLIDCGVVPYYLHLLDRVAGAAHFEVDETSATALIGRLREVLPGYLVPRLVRERHGAPYKLPVQ